MTEDLREPDKAVDYIIANAGKFAGAKAQRVYLEEFRKSKKAILVQQATGTGLERESYAYAHEDYIALLDGLREAVEAEESLRWKLIAAQARIETWRTQESSRRAGV